MVKYGQINLFVGGTSPVALVTAFCSSDTSLMASAGNPYRPQLLTYKRVDLLSIFITPGTFNCTDTLEAISIEKIIDKPVIGNLGVNTYIIKQPNTYEHH